MLNRKSHLKETKGKNQQSMSSKPSSMVPNASDGDYLVSRDSINSLRQQGSTYANIILKEVCKSGYEDRSFNLSYLKKEFRNRELEALFRRYEQRSMIGTFTQYLTLQTFLSLVYIATTAIKVCYYCHHVTMYCFRYSYLKSHYISNTLSYNYRPIQHVMPLIRQASVHLFMSHLSFQTLLAIQ